MKPTLIVVDLRVSQSSPSMKSWLRAAPSVLPVHFSAVEVWSTRCELEEPYVRWRKFPAVTRFWPVQLVFFTLSVRVARSRAKFMGPAIWQCTGELLRQCDIRYVHFWNQMCLHWAKQEPGFRLALREWCVTQNVAREEQKILQGGTGTWWVVSRGVQAAIAQAHLGTTHFRLLPNAYDETRFNHATRQQYRASMRETLGIATDETAFVFSSLGHFERKGLFSAADAVARLRARGLKCVLHVFGGRPKHIRAAERRMTPEMRAVTVFHGPVSPIEQYLAAGDAFLFPSRFEAFSLAEIEAAALGLRLYLTDHPGVEMILREPANGRHLPWDADGIAGVLEEEIKSGVLSRPHSEMGEALDTDGFAAKLSELYADVISRRMNS